MASVVESPSSRKSLSADINLVPFIDLLSVCICFLLMTAVWMQVTTIDIKQSYGTEAQAIANPLDLTISFPNEASVQLEFKRKGKLEKRILAQGNSESELTKNLADQLQPILEKIGIPNTAILTTKSNINYGTMVSVLDTLRNKKIVNIGISPGSVGEKL